ncbi:GntR family transcriptional regulator [Ectothiorhodospiraceae bacterium WFHF3C12]|nr:GntR family transcriptional regulator [Ectothiorhodospiraceae bacterium WFHF3C12]
MGGKPTVKASSDGRNLNEAIAETVGERVIRGELAPGARLLETQLAESLGVSRGPVREALRLLEKRRLVRILPRRGAVVTELSARDVDRLYDVVIPLYQLLAEKTAEHWRPEDLPPLYTVIEDLNRAAARGDVSDYFERNFTFARACAPVVDNPLLDELFADLEPALRRVLYRSWTQRAAAMDQHLDWMRQLVRQVTDRDTAGARDSIRRIGELERELARDALARP